MNTTILRTLSLALLVGTATLGVAGMATVEVAQAATVRPAVGNALKAAISEASSGNGSGALAKLREAESMPGLTASEQQAISQTKEYIAAKTGAGGGSVGCRAKFANDYNAGRYHDAIADADCLRSSGGLSGNDQLIVAQAYYLSGEYAEAIRAARAAGGPSANELILSAAFKSGDSETMRGVLEQLVSEGKTQYWTNLLTNAENTKGLKDHETLDIYRLRFRTGTMRSKDDYMLAGELALQVGSPSEAAAIMQKGIDAKVLTDDRATRLLNLAKTTAAKDVAGLGAMQKQADAAASGDADVKLGEDLTGAGRYPDAVTAIQNGIKKGVSDQGNAKVRLGQALLGAGQKDAAIRAFDSVSKDDPAQATVAHLWSIYARTSH
jgi:tetratricopeptide (TPR) repeat protein